MPKDLAVHMQDHDGMVTLTARVPPETKARVQAHVYARGLDVSAWLRLLVDRELGSQEAADTLQLYEDEYTSNNPDS